MRRKIVIVVLLLLLVGAGALTWTLLGWPPPRFVLKYGIPPDCEPTGRVAVIEGVEFVEIGPGCFLMGAAYGLKKGKLLGRLCSRMGLPWGWQYGKSGRPVHWVEFPHGFWIARTEITNAQYERFAPGDLRDEHSPGDLHPAACISWQAARDYCDWLSGKSGLDIRLPSEAAWEAACRGGSEWEFCFGEGHERLGRYGWFELNSNWQAREVGTRHGNDRGLFDLHGNEEASSERGAKRHALKELLN